ncbi:energy transducer TonB [Paraliomyxa miuraensis]|uniref:energy transducer TonB n=1 Tax=Paraliomyxa miuraensis TaxID=376150 RepID=UPI00224F66DB|nr:energy transducer TonB [Paraliomyxa miuraensis]MCX4245057.1 energy transducer TonB [Paraliomyxa miuraensis]
MHRVTRAALLGALGAGVLALPDLARAAVRTVGPAPEVSADEVQPPVLLQGVSIDYPEAAKALEPPPAGRVVVEVTIGVDGIPKDPLVVTSVHPLLDEAAASAVLGLRYTAARWKGREIEVVLPIPIDFAPPEPAPEPGDDTEPDDTEPDDTEPDDTEPDDTEPTDDATAPDAETGPVRLRGQLLEAGDRTPITNARVVVIPAEPDDEVGPVRRTDYRQRPAPPWQVRAFTDEEGRFTIAGIPDDAGSGKIRVIVLQEGYDRLEVVEALPAGEALDVRYYAKRLEDNPYRTVVEGERIEREEVARRTISTEEIRNLPGTQGDALKSIQNFPGIARAPLGIGLIVIRGSDPTDSAVFLAEHEIPQLFHFGGITSVFNSDVLEKIDFIPGNFDARYGDAIGGVIDVKPRAGRRDGYHGYIDSDLFDTGVLAEGPVDKGSFVVSGRRSYIDVILPAVIPDDAGLSISVAPRYYDYQVLFDYPVSKGNLSAKVFGSDDRTRLIAPNPNDIEPSDRDQFETSLTFHRADLAYTRREGPWDFLITPSYRYDDVGAGAGGLFRFRLIAHTFSGRAELGYRASPSIYWTVGTQVLAGRLEIDAESVPVPTPGAGSNDTRLRIQSNEPILQPAIYSTFVINLGERFVLYPSVRLTEYALLLQRTTTDPRVRFLWQVGDRTSIKGGVGLYSQIPDFPEWNPRFGNPEVLTEKALHSSLAVGRDFVRDIRIEVTGFHKTLWDLAAPSSDLVLRDEGEVGLENFDSRGLGRIYGGELFVRKALTRNVFGWLSYTLSRSERRPDPDEDWRLFDLDQTHILTLIGVYRLPKGWQVGARFRLVSGNPYTPVVGATYDASGGGYIPLAGPYNSARVPAFHQLDLRVDKRFTWKRVVLTTYLDVQNVYNRQNAEFVNYAYDYSAQSNIPSLPIIPSLGLKLEY